MPCYRVRSQVKNKKRGSKKSSSAKSWVLGIGTCLCLVGGFFALVVLFRSQGTEAFSGVVDESLASDYSPDLLRPSLANLETVKTDSLNESETPVFKGVIRQFWENGHFYYRGQIKAPFLPESDAFGLWLLRKQPFEYKFAGFVKQDEDGFWRADGEVRFAKQFFEQVLITEVSEEEVERGVSERPGKVFSQGSFVFEDMIQNVSEEGL